MDTPSFSVKEQVVRALYGRSTSLRLNGKKLEDVPACVSRLPNLRVLSLSHNRLSFLPSELVALQQLTELNLGNNALKEVPAVLGHLEALKKLYLFRNQITVLPPDVIGRLRNLVVLNLNHNQIVRLPPEITSLRKLQRLSLLDNRLEELPGGVGLLSELWEVNLTSNRLLSLPQQLCRCGELRRLHAARNRLSSLPEGIAALRYLQVVDVAGNRLVMFPVEFDRLPLQELLCEGNPFVRREPQLSRPSFQVLPLKEQVARFVLREDEQRFSLVHRALARRADLRALLTGARRCSACRGPLLATWLDAVQFVHLKKDVKVRSLQTIPVRALLCSYRCFNGDGRPYYGVAANQTQRH